MDSKTGRFWVIYPNKDGTGGIVVRADRLEVTQNGVLVFYTAAGGAEMVTNVYGPGSYFYVSGSQA